MVCSITDLIHLCWRAATLLQAYPSQPPEIWSVIGYSQNTLILGYFYTSASSQIVWRDTWGKFMCALWFLTTKHCYYSCIKIINKIKMYNISINLRPRLKVWSKKTDLAVWRKPPKGEKRLQKLPVFFFFSSAAVEMSTAFSLNLSFVWRSWVMLA